MKWKMTNFDWNQAKAFLVTAEEGSLSAAARELGLTQPTLSRQVVAIEQALGVTLFERVGKSLVLTASGIELLEHVREMGEAARRVSLAASGRAQAIEGKVVVTASDLMAAEHLPGFLKRLNAKAPLVQVEILAENEISDLLRREADIAVRHIRPEQPDLVARLVGENTANFYASDAYIEQYGRPKTIEELALHRFIGFGDNAQMIASLKQIGVFLNEENFVWNSKSGIVAWNMAKVGLGVCIMSDQIARRADMMQVLEFDLAPITFPVWLTTHRELHTSRKIRVVFDLLADFLMELNGKA